MCIRKGHEEAEDFKERAEVACTKLADALNYDHVVVFWASVSISVSLSIVAICGNSLVLLISCRKKKTIPLKDLNNVVISLAITDLFIGIVGMPVIILYSYWG